MEHHSFFRLLSPEPREKFRFPRFGSKFRYSGRTQHQAQTNSKEYKVAKNNEVSPTSGGEGGEYHPQTPHSYHGTNPQYHPRSRGLSGGDGGPNSAGNTPSTGFGNNINNDSSLINSSAPPLPNTQPPPPASNSMGVISDAPQDNPDTKENKRHTMYNPIPSATTNGVADRPKYSPRGGMTSNTNGYGGNDTEYGGTTRERFYETPKPSAPSSNVPVSVDDMDDGPELPPENFGALVSSMIRSSSNDKDDTNGTGPTSLRMQSHTTSHTKHDNDRGLSTTQETTLASASISQQVSSTSYSEEYSRRVSSVSKKSSSKDTHSDEDNENEEEDDKEDIKVLADSSIPPPTTKSIVTAEKDPITEGEVVSSSTITSRSRTVETTTYSLEREGTDAECHVEQKVTIQSDGDPIDHDEALAQAIQEATAMNPDMTVEKIEIHQTSAAPES